jgi:hypothetical protein
VGLDLPIALGDPLHFENDASFCHAAEYAPTGLCRKPESGLHIQIHSYPGLVRGRMRTQGRTVIAQCGWRKSQSSTASNRSGNAMK